MILFGSAARGEATPDSDLDLLVVAPVEGPRSTLAVALLVALGGLPGVAFMPEAPWGRASRWLTCLTIDPDAFGATREDLRLAMEAENIEARPVWKPMHLQPVYAGYPAVGGAVGAGLFERGLCLPSGSAMTDADVQRVVDVMQGVAAVRA